MSGDRQRKREPRARKNCAQCGKPRKIPRSSPPGIDRSHYENDPFCSTTCCREYYGVDVKNFYGMDPNERRGRHKRVAA